MNANLFHFPVLSRRDFLVARSPGPGLGNLLLPMARAFVGSRRFGGRLVMPTVRQIKLGTILRNEPDKRIYGTVFRHRSIEDWRNRLSALLHKQITEDEVWTNYKEPSVVRYDDMRNFFHDLSGYETPIKAWLSEKAKYKGEVRPYDIAVHIRLGDFAAHDNDDSRPSIRAPLEWYSDALEHAKRTIGGDSHQVLLFTDGRPEEIASVFKHTSCRFDPGRNALCSIMNLSRARIIVTSRSTFSMWGAFLGQSHAVWDARFQRLPYMPDRGSLDLEV